MKKIIGTTGGRPLANDDLFLLQQELTAAAAALYADTPVCIISGCRVSGTANGAYIVAPGILWCDGQLLRFAGQAAVTLPAQLQAGADTPDPTQVRPYQNGTSLACISEVPAVLVPVGTAAPGEMLPLDTWGARRWSDVQRAAVRTLGELQPLTAAGYLSAHYDTTGRGLPGSPAWGWALANGQTTTGTVDMRGLTMVGHNPDSSTFTATDGSTQTRSQNAPGDVGGEEKHTLSVPEMPSHWHSYTDRFTTTVSQTGGNMDGRVRDATATLDTAPSGGGQAHNNMQPYRVVVVRQWVGL